MGEEGSYKLEGNRLWHSSFDVEMLDNPKVILDVGAYDFGDSIRFKRKFPNCQVFGVEMSKDNYDKFSPFAENQGIHTFHLAICHEDGEIGYYQSTNVDGVNAQSSILKPGQVYKNTYNHIVKHEEKQTIVKARTLDLFTEETNIKSIDLLHVDVEGAEYHVFLGMEKIRPKMIFAEFLFDGGWIGQASFEDTVSILEKYGYKLWKRYPHDRIFILKD